MKRFGSLCASAHSTCHSLAYRELAPIRRQLHASASKAATAHPITAHGPPPKAPLPAASQYGERVDRRRRQAEMLKQGKEIRASLAKGSKGSSALKKRFWKDVHIKETPEGYQVHLDARPVRTPAKTILTVPPTKPHLAHALALEWDLLVSAQQALKHHLIPITSIISRADDIIQQEANGQMKTREDIIRTVMRYLDTDTLLCWAPEGDARLSEDFEAGEARPETLRDIQIRTAQPIIAFLSAAVWPGVEIKPVLDSDSIFPAAQTQATKDVIRGWLSGLSAYDLTALERGVLASKSLLIAARLVVEWSEEFRHLRRTGEARFGIEEAATASSLEVSWQTGMWGEVEDSHDVQKEDLKRQLGSVILLVSGDGGRESQ